jgi:arylsulfatase A-like enzyme
MQQGLMQGQFGKNHLGDRNEYLPTVHGFDGYAGVLYYLNALEEPENVDYPKDPEFFKKIGPRDVIHTWATDEEDKTEDPCFGVVSADSIEAANWLTMLDYRNLFFPDAVFEGSGKKTEPENQCSLDVYLPALVTPLYPGHRPSFEGQRASH